MFIIEVIPLVSLPQQSPQILSYFFDCRLPRGALVAVPFGSREIKAAVIESHTIESQKVVLKKSGFQLKKLSKVLLETPCFSSHQFQLIVWLAKHYCTSLSTSLKLALPPSLNAKKFSIAEVTSPGTSNATPQDPHIISGSTDRIIPYAQEQISECLYGGKQVLFLVPEISTAEFFCSAFERFVPQMIHSGMPRSNAIEAWSTAAAHNAKLFIGTRMSLFLPFSDLGLIIVEDHEHEMYKSDINPKYVARDVAEHLASIFRAKLIFTTPALSVSDIRLVRERRATHTELSSARASMTLIDMAHHAWSSGLPLFSRPLQESLISAVKDKRSILLYSARRAYSGILICKNCGGLAKCKNCNMPLRVHRVPSDIALKYGESMLVCYRCSAFHPMPDRCSNCSSSSLVPSGAPGSQRMEETLRRLMDQNGIPHPDIFIFDSDLIRDRVYELDVLSRIERSEAPIVIGTQMALSLRYTKQFHLIAVINTDALATSTDFRADERLLLQLAALADFEPKQFIVQTFTPDNPVFSLMYGADSISFYKRELEARNAFGYPPFKRLALLTFSHKSHEKAVRETRIVCDMLRMAVSKMNATEMISVSNPSPAAVAKTNGIYHCTILLKVAHDFDRLGELMKLVPTGWKIDLDPRVSV